MKKKYSANKAEYSEMSNAGDVNILRNIRVETYCTSINFEYTAAAVFRADDICLHPRVEAHGRHPGTDFPVSCDFADFNLARPVLLGERQNGIAALFPQKTFLDPVGQATAVSFSLSMRHHTLPCKVIFR